GPGCDANAVCTLQGGAGVCVCKAGYAGSGKTCSVCAPSCSGKTCGSDGCGGQCGVCGGNQACSSGGLCVCTPQCNGKTCGPDGCGGQCGSCGSGQACNGDGQCAKICVPQCQGKACGPDGCGGECGSCGAEQFCHLDTAQCRWNACPGAQTQGCCSGNSLVSCGKTGLSVSDCNASSTWCSWDADKGAYACMAKNAGAEPTGKIQQMCVAVPPCKPVCDGKSCGSDGCGGSCGTCKSGDICVFATGKCIPDPCAGIGPSGCCQGNDRVTCAGGKPAKDVCGGDSAACGWDGAASYTCGQSGATAPEGGPAKDCPASLCIPNCTGKVCGSDGCGGVCGTCGAKQTCTAGSCCTPDCTNKNCGSDGCGGSCGTCGEGLTCSAAEGVCIGTDACQGAPYDVGCCFGQTVKRCKAPMTLQSEDCSKSDGVCGWDAKYNRYGCGTQGGKDPSGKAPMQCAGAPACVPQCTGKSCGPDGCGGLCENLCSAGTVCNAKTGTCVPGCNGLTMDGCCQEGKLFYCGQSDKFGSYAIQTIDCKSKGMACGWSVLGKYSCLPATASWQSGPDEKCPAAVTQCKPQCDGKACGPDGCGGSCGTCASFEQCEEWSGTCYVPPPDCKGNSWAGTCNGSTLTFCSASEQIVSKDCGMYAGKFAQCGYDVTLMANTCWTSSALVSGKGQYTKTSCTDSWVGTCGQYADYWACECDAGCTSRGDCCGDFYEACGEALGIARCGDGTCSTGKGENCATCAADCQSQCTAAPTSLDPPWAPPFAPVLAMAGTAAQKAEFAQSVLDEVVPAQPPLPLRGLLTHISAPWAHTGSPLTHVSYTSSGGGGLSDAPGRQGPALGMLQNGKPSGGNVQIAVEPQLPRPTDYASGTLGGTSLAMWVKLAADAPDGLHPLAATVAAADNAEQTCAWSRPGDAAVTVTCSPLAGVPRKLVALYGYYGSVANTVTPQSGSQFYFTPSFPRGSCAVWQAVKPTYQCEFTGIQPWLEAKCLGKSSCHIDPWTVAKDPCVTSNDPNIKSTLLVRALCAPDTPKSSAWLAIGDKTASNRLRFEVPGLPPLLGSTALGDGAWHHVALVYRAYTAAQKAGVTTLYVDGQPDGSTESLQPPNFSSLTVGSAVLSGGVVPAGAEIDEVFLYDRALSDPEVRTLRNTPDLQVTRVWPPVSAELAATVGAWGQGKPAATASIDAAKVLGPGFTTAGQNTQLLSADYRALHIAQDQTWGAAVPTGDVPAGNTFTLAAWLRVPAAGPVGTPVLRLVQGGVEQVAIQYADGCGGRGLQATAKGGKPTALASCDHGLQPGTWTFVSYVQDGTSQSLRVDGHELATGTAGATLLAEAVTQTALEIKGPADLGWAALFAGPVAADSLQRWRTQGPAVWLDGARYGKKDETQLRDYADFSLASDAAAGERKPSLWTLKGEPAKGSAAAGPLVLQGSEAAVLTVPAKGRFAPIAAEKARPLSWSAHLRVAGNTVKAQPVHLLEHRLAGKTEPGFAAALVCQASGAAWACRIELRYGQNTWTTEQFALSAASGTLPPATLDLDVALAWDGKQATAAVGSRGSADASPVEAKALTVAAYPAVDKGSEPATDAWLTGEAFVLHAPTASGASLELNETRLYPRVLTELELVGLVRRTCTAVDCGHRVCSTGLDGTALPACGPCSTGYREAGDKLGDVCLEARPFMAVCSADEQCTTGICAEGRCQAVAATDLCKSACAAQHRQCVAHKSSDPAATMAGGKIWGCSASCDPWYAPAPSDPNHGTCTWAPITPGGAACSEDLACLSGKCVENDTPKFDGSGTLGGKICAHPSAQACATLHREAIAHKQGGVENRTWYTCGGCAKDLYLGKPLWQSTRRLLTKAGCANATAAGVHPATPGSNEWLSLEYKFNLTGRGLNKLFLNKDAALVPSDMPKLRALGVGPVMLAFGLAHNDAAIVLDTNAAMQSMTLYNCDTSFRYNDPVENAPICVGTPYPDGTPCPPPGVSASVDQANEFCESGFCARDTKVCEPGAGKVEDTKSAARQDAKSSERSDYGPLTITQDNRATLQFQKVAGTGSNGTAPQRQYALAASVTHSASLFGSPSFDVVGMSLTMHAQMEQKKAQYQARLFLLGVEMPAVKSLVPPSACKDKIWVDGEYQAPPEQCGVAMKAKTLTPEIPKIKIEKTWNACEVGEGKKPGLGCVSRSGFVGPVPVSVESALETVAGMELGLAIDSLTFEPGFAATPHVAIQVVVKGGVGGKAGPLAAFAGVKGELRMVDLGLPVTWALKIAQGKDALGKVIEGLYTVTWSRGVSAELTILKLSLSLFAEVGLGPIKAEWEYPLFQSGGLKAVYELGSAVLQKLK
ncbi:MAG: hypothetical protein HY902_11740, partial [Deltaproteobacteria bacterium]|nr:hypothetical protein [Deltaproteobacteria bacterium]